MDVSSRSQLNKIMEFEKDVISRLEFSLSVPLDATDWKTTCELPSVEER